MALVDTWLGAAPPQPTQQRLFYRGERTRPDAIMGTTERFVDVNFAKMFAGRVFTEQEVIRRRNVAVIGYGPYQALFATRSIDPIGKMVRIGAGRVHHRRRHRQAARRRRLQPRAGRLRDHSRTRRTASSSAPSAPARGPFGGTGGMIAVVPLESATREETMREVESIMRIRHGLTLDKPNDFDLVTSDAILAVWDQISSAILLSLVVISSIALMVGGIGVMAIMTISVTERTREIGVRKAIGARRREILVQFLIEAVVLTSVGGVLGVAARQRASACSSTSCPASRCRCRGGRSRSASASPPRSASSSASSPPGAPRASIRSRRCATSRLGGSAS